ncbi:AraC family transcriptional regulator [Croceicoccus sediminis]|uniref:AraC family transcriptional regulator n=1 Tax=Croceicoccus sediminis TaxID=2571150 RepID=UPI0011824F31|nr:AraC family transcriptional regulator [Croceicoccus sediminis]
MAEHEHGISSIWPSGELPMMRWNRFNSGELGDVHRHMTSAFCPHRLVTEGNPPISFRHNQVDVGSCTLNATDYGLPFGRVAVSIPPAEHSYLVQFVIEGRAHFRHQGREFTLDPGKMAVISPHEPTEQITEAGCKHFTIKLDRKQIEDLLREDLGQTKRALIFAPDPVFISGVAASFVQFVRAIIGEMDGATPAYTHHRAMRTSESMLGRLLLGAVPHSYSFDYEFGETSAAAPYYVKKAEEFMRAFYKERLTLDDIVQAAGVSSRSLTAGFRRFREETPMGWLKQYRLARAREMLERGMPGELTVTTAALANGFAHPGKFTQGYRKFYGEAPSETLRRQSIRTS